jgi:LuxR family transcriptional regulator, maltose regulon positive regulatory protein
VTTPRHHRPLAKLSSPTVGNIYPRTRLYQLWDTARETAPRIVWLAAPAGSGKTLSVADYLRQHKLPVLWYQLDEGDADPATFFHCLGQAVDIRGSVQLPSLTPEYVLGLPVFTRNYFRALSKHLKAHGVIVFDNYQDLPDAAVLHELLSIGIAELPADITVMVLSRTDPPASFSRWRAHGALRLNDWEQLCLTEEENTGLCRYLKGDSLSAEAVKTLYDHTKGWITGLVLLLESDQPLAKTGDKQNVLFDYFAHEIFSRAEPSTQELLLRSAVLAEMTIDSIAAVTGHAGAQQVIEDLCRRNFFIVKLADTPVHYRYHPLFRQYLLATAQAKYGEEQFRKLMGAAAQTLYDQQSPELALPLYLAAHDFPKAMGCLLQVAEAMHEQGRDATMRAWIGQIPETLLLESGGTQFWLGQAHMTTEPSQALNCFELAYHRFAQQQDVAGMYRAISGGCRALYLSQRIQAGQDIWLQRFADLDHDQPLTETATDTADVLANVLLAAHWRDPTNSILMANLPQAERIWAETEDIDKRLNLGVTLTAIWAGLGRMQEATSLLQQQQTLVEQTTRVSLSVLWHYVYQGFAACFTGKLDQSLVIVDRGLGLAEESGIHVADLLLLGIGIHNSLLLGRLSLADQYLDRMQHILALMPLNLDAAHYHALLGWRQLWEGNAPAACLETKKALDIAKTIGAKYPVSFCRYGMAHAHIANGDYDQAQSLLQQAHCPFGEGTYRRLDYEIALAEAYVAILRGDRQCALNKIKQGMRIAIEDGYGPPLWGYPDFLRAVFVLALEEQIKAPTVHKLIRTARLAPSPAILQSDIWPFPIKIYTLGRFSVLHDDAPLLFSGKAQKKPMELLKALIAFGGREVAEEKLAAALWTDAEGDIAHSALRTTLHRLRKLLENDEAIAMQEGRLTLDPLRVWVDVWAVERLMSETEHRLQDSAVDPDSLVPVFERLMRWYQGPFLTREAETAWMLSLRERLHTRVLRLLRNLIMIFSRHGDCERVIELYETALQLDDLAEDLYRGLMICHAAQGRRAETLAVYERCARLLDQVLLITPSPETAALHAELRANDFSAVAQRCEACRRGQRP